jgi:hypothetical protein
MSAIEAICDADLTRQIRDPRLLQLYDYWRDRRGHRRFPTRRDIDPLQFRYVLGYVMMVDVEPHDSPRYRVRLRGSEMAQRARYDLTGKFLEDLPDSEYRAYVLGRCASLLRKGDPEIIHHDRVLDGEVRKYEALWLPFSENGSDVTMLMCALIYAQR